MPDLDFPGRDFRCARLEGKSQFVSLQQHVLWVVQKIVGYFASTASGKRLLFLISTNCKRVPSALPRDIVRSGFVCAELLPKKERSGRSHFFRDGSPDQINGGVWVYS